MTCVLYMWGARRRSLIAEHQFYVSEGRKRLTDQFADNAKLESEADEFGTAWLQEASKRFDPDRDDEGSFYEQAHDEVVQHFQALNELGNSARLALISGMFHLWERSLRDWLASNDGVGHFRVGEHLPKAIWGSNFDDVLEIFEGVKLFQNGCSIRDRLNVCRMIVNTYKHGVGPSAEQLKTERPELFDQYGWKFTAKFPSYTDWEYYSDLYVQDAAIDEFATAIEEFWNAIPEHIMDTDIEPVPKWFQKAFDKDCKGASNGQKA